MKKVIIKGGYGLANFGDDALMKVIYDDYLPNDIDIYFCSEYANYLTTLAPRAKFITEVKVVDDVDFLIYGGGTQFYSFRPKKSLVKRIIAILKRPKVLKSKILELFIKEQTKSQHKIGALGIGLGPFLPNANPQIENNTFSLFKKMDFIAVRDTYSEKKCQEWNLKTFHHLTDICYASNHERYFQAPTKSSIENIAVVVRDWEHTIDEGNYSEQLVQAVGELRNKYRVKFLVFSKKRDKKWIKLLGTLSEDFHLWDPDKFKVDDFTELLSSFDLFISARYHGAIYATLLGKPFIAIEVEQKLNMIGQVYEGGSKVWSFPYKSNELVEMVALIDENYNQYSNQILNITKTNVQLALNMKKMFQEFISSN